MDLPGIFTIGTNHLPVHLIFEIVAYGVGFNLYRIQRKRTPDNLKAEQRILIFIGAIFGALIGSKVLSLMEHPDVFASPEFLLYMISSKSVVGGLLGGLIGVETAKKIIGVKFSTGDAFTYPLIIGMMIGRIGCFLSGVHDGTHGSETSFFLGMDLGDGVIRHPTALYEIFILAAIALFIYTLNRNMNFMLGAKFKLFMMLYLSWRLFIEFYKPVYVLPYIHLSAIQLWCVLGLIYYYKNIIRPSHLLERAH